MPRNSHHLILPSTVRPRWERTRVALASHTQPAGRVRNLKTLEEPDGSRYRARSARSGRATTASLD